MCATLRGSSPRSQGDSKYLGDHVIFVQEIIIAEIEAEQELVAASCELIERFEKKIQIALAHLWGGNERSSKDVSQSQSKSTPADFRNRMKQG